MSDKDALCRPPSIQYISNPVFDFCLKAKSIDVYHCPITKGQSRQFFLFFDKMYLGTGGKLNKTKTKLLPIGDQTITSE